MLSFFSVLSSSGGSREELITIQVGNYRLSFPKVPDVYNRGSKRVLSDGEVTLAQGSHVPLEAFSTDLWNISIQQAGAGASYSFTIVLEGDLSVSIPRMRVTPENYGGSFEVDALVTSGITSYTFTLPNANLFNNWIVGSTRTCLLEIV